MLWPILLAAGVIIAAGVGVYLNSFQGGCFLADDGSIVDNPKLGGLWPPWATLPERRR